MARLKRIERLTLRHMMRNFTEYAGVHQGLLTLPLPDSIRIGYRSYPVPADVDEFCKNITYGQRLFLTREEPNDFGLIIRALEGYYYPIVKRKKWDEDKALVFGKIIITCKVKDLYPIAMHLIGLIAETLKREEKLLHRQPTKKELAAGIEKLNPFAELSSLDFLRDNMKITMQEVMLTPYNECLVRFMLAKETMEYQERYYKLLNEPTHEPGHRERRTK
jgi:hypothetical protein